MENCVDCVINPLETLFLTLPETECSEGYVSDPPKKREKWPFPATSNGSKIFLKRDLFYLDIKYH